MRKSDIDQTEGEAETDVIRHPSSVIRHPSSVIRHPSSVIRHLAEVGA